MWTARIIDGDVWPPHVERIERAWLTRAGDPYASYRSMAPDDPAVDLHPEAAETVPGPRLIDRERGDIRRVWRMEDERINLSPGAATERRTGAHGVGAGAGRAR